MYIIFSVWQQVAIMIVTTTIVSLLPPGNLRRYLGAISYKISIRVLIRSLSVVTTFHDTQYSPGSGGFCVANHTSPIDVAIVSVRTCFSLVVFFGSIYRGDVSSLLFMSMLYVGVNVYFHIGHVFNL